MNDYTSILSHYNYNFECFDKKTIQQQQQQQQKHNKQVYI